MKKPAQARLVVSSLARTVCALLAILGFTAGVRGIMLEPQPHNSTLGVLIVAGLLALWTASFCYIAWTGSFPAWFANWYAKQEKGSAGDGT